MIVSLGDFHSVVDHLRGCHILSLDTETAGLLVWHTDRLFSVVFGTPDQEYYFNFKEYDGLDPNLVLPLEYLKEIKPILQDGARTLFMHNAKFDLGMLHKEGLEVSCHIHDTEVAARLEYNDHFKYDLASCAARIGKAKSEAVEEYIKKHGLWEWRTIPGKKTRVKNKFFYKVPFDIMSTYALQDARVTFDLGIHQLAKFDELLKEEDRGGYGTIHDVCVLEGKVTKASFLLEKVGVKIDARYCEEAIRFEDIKMKAAADSFENMSGFEFKDSGKHLAVVFHSLGLPIPQTALGNPSFTDEILSGMTHPAAKFVGQYRDAQKRANTYFRSFLFRADENDVIHTNLRQAGTRTGRFSCADPNLQNLTKDDDEGIEYPVRRAFIPREDFIFVMIDYDQMEFRMMLDYAQETSLIDRIKSGLDPHQATADLTGLTRKASKTLNFGLLYGMGVDKLAKSLDVGRVEAERFKELYFDGLPRVQRFFREAKKRAARTKKLWSWAGRLFHFPNPDFSYKGANAIIQGGCADVVKKAMVEIDHFLRENQFKSRMLLQIHDELLFEIHKTEFHIVQHIKKIMEDAYPHRSMPLTCSVSHSLRSWSDSQKGMPGEIRDQVQCESKEGSTLSQQRDPEHLLQENTAGGA